MSSREPPHTPAVLLDPDNWLKAFASISESRGRWVYHSRWSSQEKIENWKRSALWEITLPRWSSRPSILQRPWPWPIVLPHQVHTFPLSLERAQIWWWLSFSSLHKLPCIGVPVLHTCGSVSSCSKYCGHEYYVQVMHIPSKAWDTGHLWQVLTAQSYKSSRELLKTTQLSML